MTLKNSAAIILDDLGRAGTLRQVTEGTYSPATGGVSNTTSDFTIQLALLNYSDRQFDGDIIQRGDRKAVIKAKDMTVVPDIQDLIIIGSETYRIINVRQVEESGVDVVYICQCRI